MATHRKNQPNPVSDGTAAAPETRNLNQPIRNAQRATDEGDSPGGAEPVRRREKDPPGDERVALVPGKWAESLEIDAAGEKAISVAGIPFHQVADAIAGHPGGEETAQSLDRTRAPGRNGVRIH